MEKRSFKIKSINKSNKMKKNKNLYMLKHPYHLVDVSPWPLLLSLSVLSAAISFINWISGDYTII
jgi:hypothetical protein